MSTRRRAAQPRRQPAPNTQQPDLSRALPLALELMAIPGRSGEEGAVVDAIVSKLRKAGAPAQAIVTDDANRRTPIAGQTGNLILKLPGTWRGPRRMLVAHLDTVPLCVGSRPVVENGLVRSGNPATGLGADDRAGAAVLVHTATEILRRRLPHPPLTFLWPVQEEIGLQGARCVKKSLLGAPRLAFNWDGGAATKLSIGATGGYRLAIEVRGLAAHAGGEPQRGVSAIAIASLAIADLVESGWHGLIEKRRGAGTSNVGVIRGGEATNVVTDFVQLRAEARSHDPAFRQRIVERIEKAFRRAAAAVKNDDGAGGEVRFDGRLDYESFRLDPQEPCVQAAVAAFQSLGREPQLVVANGGLDANWLTAHGIPTVTMGCGQLRQHTLSEALDIEQFHLACQVAWKLATAA